MTRVEQALAEHGRPLLGFSVQQYNPMFVEIIGALGAQVLWIEAEHQAISLPQVLELCRTATSVGLLTMVRIADARRENVLRAAECAPDIIDLPMANSPDIVAEYVRHAKYPPIGRRGFFGGSRALRYGVFEDVVAEQERVNRELCLMAQIETREALEQVDEILSVPGLDAVFIGPGDLSSSLGITGQMTHPMLLEAMERIIAAGKRYGKLVAIPGGPDDVHRWSDRGVDLFFIGGDTGCMKQAAEAALAQARRG